MIQDDLFTEYHAHLMPLSQNTKDSPVWKYWSDIDRQNTVLESEHSPEQICPNSGLRIDTLEHLRYYINQKRYNIGWVMCGNYWGIDYDSRPPYIGKEMFQPDGFYGQFNTLLSGSPRGFHAIFLSDSFDKVEREAQKHYAKYQRQYDIVRHNGYFAIPPSKVDGKSYYWMNSLPVRIL